jgi:diacylglycerol kinase family enzyme
MGLGFDAQVASRNYVEPGEVARSGGKGKYLWHIISTLLFYRESRARIRSNEHEQESACFMNTIAIGRRFAGGFLLTPEAMANDGLLDICMIEKVNLFQRFRILPMVPKGTHIRDPKVEYYQTEKISVDFGKKVPFHVDGELYFDTTFEVDLLPSALSIIYNPEGKHFFNA